uniref:Uncharacterized protein n=1 Tax=Eutreptiella gymnastica TaxID=73025 RepID=A0A7S4LCD7_9EUGL
MQTVPERDPQGAAKAEQVEETNRGRDTGEDGQGEFQQSEFHQKACRSILVYHGVEQQREHLLCMCLFVFPGILSRGPSDDHVLPPTLGGLSPPNWTVVLQSCRRSPHLR